MTELELIGKQQLEIEQLTKDLSAHKNVMTAIHAKLVCISEPLNDNVLQFNSKQLQFLAEIDNWLILED